MSRWIKPFEENLRIDRPKMYQRLKESGQLNEYLNAVKEQASELALELSKQGMNPFQAESEAIRTFLLPSEEDQPNLGETPPKARESRFDLLLFLSEKADQFLAWREPNDKRYVRDLFEMIDEEAALHISEKDNSMTIAEAIYMAAERTPTGIHGLREWLENMPKEQRDELILEEIAEELNYGSDLT